MRLAACFFFLGLVFPIVGEAQPCAPVQFLTSADIPAYQSGVSTFGLRRQQDGSFTQLKVLPVSPYTLLDSVPNFQNQIFRCTELRLKPRIIPPGFSASLGTVLAGVMSMNTAATDLSGDGSMAMLDIATPTSLGFTVRIADANGRFKTETSYAVGSQPSGILVGDFNEDGKKDVAVIYYGNTRDSGGGVSLLLGNGDGTLKTALDIAAGNGSTSGTFWDFNNDSHLDMAIVNRYAHTVSILLGDGHGGFVAAPIVVVPGEGISITVADINGDARGDLVVGIGDNPSSVSIHRGNGNGTFQEAQKLSIGVRPGYLALSDMNKDGRLDLVAADGQTGIVNFVPGTFNGFGGGTRLAVGATPTQIQLLDFDLDSNLDIVVASGHPAGLLPDRASGSLKIVLGNGNGTFRAPPAYDFGGQARQLAKGDFNKDGRLDLVTGNAPGGTDISVLLGTAAGTYELTSRLSADSVGVTSNSVTSIVVGDFNKDGNSDIVLAIGSGVSLLKGVGDGTFEPPLVTVIHGDARSIVAEDFNRDGTTDVVVAIQATEAPLSEDRVTVLFGSTGALVTGPSFDAGTKPASVAAFDFDHDAVLDVAVANEGDEQTPGSITIHYGDPDGSFPVRLILAGVGSVRLITVADLNEDGLKDIVAATVTPDGGDALLSALTLSGRHFGPFVSSPLAANAKGFAVADFNVDGSMDVAVAHCCNNGGVTLHSGNGDGTFQPEVHLDAEDSPSGIVAGTFSEDGVPDLAVATSPVSTGDIIVMPNLWRARLALILAGGSFAVDPVSPSSIVIISGSFLSTQNQGPAPPPYPTVLGNTRVTVVDSQGVERDAGLIYASSSQINFLMPADTANGSAFVRIQPANGLGSVGNVEVRMVAPSFFMLNQQRLVAANVIRLKPNGQQVYEQVFKIEPGTGALVAAPIDFGNGGDRLFLEMYGTGFSSVTNLQQAEVRVGSTILPMLYVGPQGTPGLDQVDVEIPRTLAGRGSVDVAVTIAGVPAALVRVSLK